MAHIIVVGNEKGGAGKSTVAMHVATALARLGHKVGMIDLDLRQKTTARYLANRKTCRLPSKRCFPRSTPPSSPPAKTFMTGG